MSAEPDRQVSASYDPEVDVLMIRLRPFPRGLGVTYGERIDHHRIVHRERTDSSVLGVEFLWASDGISLEGLPEANEIREVVRKLHNATRAAMVQA